VADIAPLLWEDSCRTLKRHPPQNATHQDCFAANCPGDVAGESLELFLTAGTFAMLAGE
jgi:hypothetical protein